MKITNVSAYILVRSRFFLAALIAGLGLMWAGRGNAQTLAPVYSFSASPASTNSDGANPYAGLVLSGSTVYGVAQYGGTNGDGVVFAVNLDGSGFTNLYNFTGGNDGAHPQGGLILAGGTLYGTTVSGGTNNQGAVFALSTNGTGFAKLYSFTGGNDGANPEAGLILAGGTLYGTTVNGGTNDEGAVFAINTDGTGFTNIYSLAGG